ncbi:recombination protein O N-terminal domain-containing protein [Mangrovivirga sp. M17]|uniref:DNA repair protein RecO n=1 Tax=Mangrovivirga halotolerans TaxID=2993936 RepID=A0ABT3RRX3_9BACT|nr:recombination protein O N-terminal domain-containing protein [Mangrovivirga halotolerans]MCX2744533.1 recombination protein O N-terminal domain-containing protein [Mangrovivirga halotolerans]
MLTTTQGIVFNYIKYGESSIICRIFTREKGLKSFIINSARTSKGKGKIALYQPLNLLEMVIYDRNDDKITRINEARIDFHYKTIPFDPVKRGIGLFLSEILFKIVKQDEDPQPIHDFIRESICTFDQIDHDINNFHLKFLIKLSPYLGLNMESGHVLADEMESFYNLKINQPILEGFEKLSSSDYGEKSEISNTVRRELLHVLIDFYRYHLDIGELKSLPVLIELYL